MSEKPSTIKVPDATALLVSGSPAGVSAPLLHWLAARSDFVLAVDSGAEQLAAAGILPDLLLGDLDSLSEKTFEYLKTKGVPLECFDMDKDATDLELGIEALSLRGYRRLIATNVSGGRTDHLLGSLGALASAAHDKGMQVAYFDEHEACYFVSSNATGFGFEQVLELSFGFGQTQESGSSLGQTQESGSGPGQAQEPGLSLGRAAELDYATRLPRYLSLIAWGGPVTVSLQGTKWPLSHYELTPNSALGVSNTLNSPVSQHELTSNSARGASNTSNSPVIQLEVHEGDGTALLLLSY